jgi:methyl-accepting chemotaxis protein
MNKFSFKNKLILIGTLIFFVFLFESSLILYNGSNIKNDSDILVNKNLLILNKGHDLKLTVVQVQQWLTDISATRGMNGLNDGFDETEKMHLIFTN